GRISANPPNFPLHYYTLFAYSDGCPKLEIPGRTFPVDALFLEDVLHLTKFNMPPDVLYRFNKTNQRMAQMRAQSVASPPITPDIRQNFKHWLKRATPRLSPGSLQFLEALDIHGCPPPEFVAVVIDYIIQTTDSGAILAFVPGLGDILDTMKTLRNMNPAVYGQASGRVVLHGLHSRLPTARQRTVFDPPPFGKRKVVIATNIAETSITIEDIVYVVDCGQIKITTYDPQMNTSTLAPVLVSKANAAQRRGRAGRVRPGRCFHLFSSFTYERVMLDYLPPEIMRIRLEDIILRIKALDLGPVTSFLANCMDPPALEAVRSTLKFLRDIQALKPPNPSGPDSPTGSTSVPVARLSTMKKKQRDRLVAGAIEAGKTSVAGARNQSEEDYDNDVLTPLGHHLANLPMDPQCAKLLILGTLFCCLKPALAVAACLAFKEPFEVPIGSEAAADRRRAELTEGSQSDHWGFYVALSEYMDLREHEKYNFCKKNFLNRNTMDDLCRLMHEFVGLLYERRYITSMDMNESAVNRHSHDVRIFRAALAGAFYPNLILASARKRKPNGVLPAPIIKGPSSDEKVALHSKSVNANLRPLDHLWFVYFQKMKLDHGAASTIFDSTLLSARPVVFFSSKLTQTTVGSEGLLVVDGWIKFKAGPRVPRLIEGLKLCLDRLLDSKIRNLGSTNWDPSSIEGRIIQTIVDYFINEAPPAFEIADHSRAPVWKQHQQQQQGGGNVQTHHGAQTMNKPKR
uniref:Helicase C-terminal domain-containing protein n=1 Tax=Mesocestoides corti TaxID=53468 RepID=A0A5K3F875_MESCO